MQFKTLPMEEWQVSRTLRVMLEATHLAGKILFHGFYSRFETYVKDDQSDYTPFDLKAEEAASTALSSSALFQKVDIFGEDSKRVLRPEDLIGKASVFIDGIDGTTNFSRGIPVFNFTMNYAVPSGPDGRLELEAGVVYDPIHGEMFYAERNSGAFLNGTRIQVTERPFNKSVITFAPLRNVRKDKGEDEKAKVQALWNGMREITEKSGRFHREFQSGGQELSWVASGRLDGYASSWTNPWDLGAGVLIVREAGGTATDIYGNDWQPSYDGVIAGSKTVHPELYRTLKTYFENHRRM